MPKIYSDMYQTDEDRIIKKQSNCSHPFWTKRCSTCNKILDNDKLHEEHPEHIVEQYLSP